MSFKESNVVTCDVLVIGGGGAGLRAAIEARESGADVVLVSKSRVGYGNNTILSYGAFAAATGWPDPRDNPEIHIRDTVKAGRFINDQRLLAAMAQEAAAQVPFLEKCGVKYLRKDGKILVTQNPGHSYPRQVRSEHRSGKDLTPPLREYAGKIGTRFAEGVFITKLLVEGNQVAAATGIDLRGNFLVFVSKCTILTTGGFAQIYLRTDNAAGITGDGLLLAFDLGISLKDMEFIQFYPTAIGRFGSRLLIYEEFVFHAGAVLKNAAGEDIVVKHGLTDPAVMTRDRLTQAIMHEILEGRDVDGGVVLDLGKVSEEALSRLAHLLPAGWLSDRRAFIVAPTTHFCMGGIVVDENAETRVPGLFAAGEVCAGVHGANRIGGNALCEAFAMGAIAGRGAALKAKSASRPEFSVEEASDEKARLESLFSGGKRRGENLRRSVKEVMWYKAGIIRNRRDLEGALGRIEELRLSSRGLEIKDFKALVQFLELQNMLVLAEMVCRAALLRSESRGGHYRADYPEEDDEKWLKNIVINKKGSGMAFEAIPVAMDFTTP